MTEHSITIRILDGGLGTTLQTQHPDAFNGPDRPLWSSHFLITNADMLRDTQSDFADAGADIILTATYQASFEGFLATRVPEHEGGIGEDHAARYMRSAVKVSREAFATKKDGLVALSLGAYGAIMVPSQEYSGKYDIEHSTAKQLEDWHLRRLRMYEADQYTWSNVDYVAFETLPSVIEIEAVRKTMASVIDSSNGSKPFWISCVFPQEMALPDGSSMEEVARAMLGGHELSDGARPFAIGINCTRVEKVETLLSQLEEAIRNLISAGVVDKWPALVLYPDGTAPGQFYNTVKQKWEFRNDDSSACLGLSRCRLPGCKHELSEVSWAEKVAAIVLARYRRPDKEWASIIVGGCCKTGPNEIKQLREAISRGTAIYKNI